MQTWIALLRGINVGGHNILPMQDLRNLFTTLNFQNVRTYIQSGNCVFDASESAAEKLSSRISEAIEAEFSFRPSIMLLKKHDLKAAILGNPFAQVDDIAKTVHLFFLAEQANNANLSALSALKKPSEEFLLSGQVFYLYAPEGIGRSKLVSQVEKHLQVSVTARNYRSVTKILQLTE